MWLEMNNTFTTGIKNRTMKTSNKRQLLLLIATILLCQLHPVSGTPIAGAVVQNNDVDIISGPSVRIPGITTPTVIQVTGSNESYPIRWLRNGGGVVGGGTTLSLTVGGTYYAEMNLSTVPENPFWRPLGSITIPALDQTLQVDGSNPIDPLVPTQLCVSTNASAYVTSMAWYRNSLLEPAQNGRTCRYVLYPGSYQVRVTYQYGSQTVTINSNVLMTGSSQAPAVQVSKPNHDPVSAPPVLTVTNAGSFIEFLFMRNTEILARGTSPSYTVTRPGTYMVGGRLPNGYLVYTNDIAIAKGSIPAPVMSSDGNFELSHLNTHLRLATASNYTAGYTWYYNNQVLPAGGNTLDVTRPGTYKVTGCAVHPDQTTECKSSADYTVTRTPMPLPSVYADGGGQLTYQDPEVRLSTPGFGNGTVFTWYFNSQVIHGASSSFVDIRSPGTYTVRACFTYPDGVTSCSSTSAGMSITAEVVKVNYVRNKKARVPNITDPAQLDTRPFDEVNIATTYFDGFSRPVQQVIQAGSPQGNDMVSFFAYDAFGREAKKYLPFARQTQHGQYIHLHPENPAQLNNFYQDNTDAIADTGYPFSKTIFEPSPVNRVIEQGAPGEAWQPGTVHTLKYVYSSNPAHDNVLIWNVTPTGVVATTTYAAAELAVEQITDEHDVNRLSFTDKEGRQILQIENDGGSLRTYFVYDDLGRLTCVIPPKVSRGLSTTLPVTLDEATLGATCFRFAYDERGRMIKKQVPGAGPTYIVYDLWDRPVLSQTANQRIKKMWSFIKYDALDRAIMTGEVTLPGTYEAVRDAVNSFYSSLPANLSLRYETAGTAVHEYTNRSYPILSDTSQAYVITYYDNYAFLPRFGAAYNFAAEPAPGPTEAFARSNGLVTGIKSIVLGTRNYLKTVNYYNNRYQPIQTVAGNYAGGRDRISSRYDFVGNLIGQHSVHQGAETVQVWKEYAYDHGGRVLTIHHRVNDGPTVLLADNHFNALGELIEKNIHSAEGSKFLQSLDYRYNIRGWLSTMNDLGQEPGADYNDLYAFKLSYNEFETEANMEYQAAYNGNISAFTEIRPSVDGSTPPFKSVFTYKYDYRNQLKQAKYYQPSNRVYDGYYDLLDITYDANGNINGLQRKGLINGAPGVIDNLHYHYNGNQLQKVDELASPTEGFIKK